MIWVQHSIILCMPTRKRNHYHLLSAKSTDLVCQKLDYVDVNSTHYLTEKASFRIV